MTNYYGTGVGVLVFLTFIMVLIMFLQMLGVV